ncbi:hypothetical protein BU25DRAFT_348820 [Macroventuria anomochaeta]|uniref:Uncharacterized protein n=1 Tax=Macroventuria anomochaeta TaxID=301207 RepID=A0ACB6RQK7_9PLEO|nr:uncharacterized protein BU25DRAFT_348820 [Macroventuria anomochaeta]KAF2624064.1 hypothetical protein BU25DRAFT_348820 [Macroventuria anomochaeta]
MTTEGDETEDIDIHELDHDPISNTEADRMIIAIDFGTTFSSVAYAVLPRGVAPERIDLRHIKCIGNYPGYEPPEGVLDFRQDVPTELWYDDGLTGSWRQPYTNGFDDDIQGSEGEKEDSSSDEDGSDNQESRSQFDDGNEIEGLTNTQSRARANNTVEQYWGYEVQQKLNEMNAPRDDARPLTRIKLNLIDGSDTKDIQTELRANLRTLRRRRIIDRDTDIYKHYLSHLLEHTKEQLLFSNELQQDTLIQFVLCVPAKWPGNACRNMQTALEQAVKQVGFSKNADDDVCNLFMISEPEAAAECILAEAGSELYNNETVVVLDAGGGTVDAVTYKCVNGDPVRLAAEVVAPDSKLCGASYINERYEKKLLQKLANETYLVNDPYNTKSLKSIVQVRTGIFENYQKRIIDTTKRKEETFRVRIENLRENRRKGFYSDNLELKRKTMKNFFEPSLAGAKEVLENQLDLAENKDRRVEKVILTGGFGQSPSLQSYLRKYLAERTNAKGRNIDLVVPQNPSTAVARGAVLRALNKRFGPSRIIQCSYGFILSELYEPEEVEAHRRTKCRINKVDGERYVDGTIRWVLRAGQRVENMQAFTFHVKHTFPQTNKKLLCAEQLWMSDSEHPDHYRKTHALNKGAVMVGYLEADLTRLKDEGRIALQQPSEYSTYTGSQKKYYEVHYEVALIVEGRSIHFEARYPVKDNLRPGEKQEVLGAKLVGIAAAFAPGTA